MQYAEIREALERKGYILQDAEYNELVQYARRKASVAGNDESYIPLLLPDVVREHYMRTAINRRWKQ